MAKCKFKTEDGWECPLEAEPGKDYCYWHKKEKGKRPDKNQLEVLKNREIKGADLSWAYLEGADLSWAYLEGAGLGGAHLEGANLQAAYLKGANLSGADLKRADLSWAYLKGADLRTANLEGADLNWADLEGADLSWAHLEGAGLGGAHLEGANLERVRVDGKTDLTDTLLNYSNLFYSYIDETKTLRNAEFDSKSEINEIVANLLRKKDIKLTIPILKKAFTLKRNKIVVLDGDRINDYYPNLYKLLKNKGFLRYSREYMREYTLFFFNREDRCFVIHPGDEYTIKTKETEEIAENLDKFLLQNPPEGDEEGPKEYKKKLIIKFYEASYDVFNMLYYFYIQNGKLGEALEMHKRRSDVQRKLLMAKGGWNKIRAIFYNYLILKVFTGYGVDIFRPILISVLTVLFFAGFFWITGGITKLVNGIPYKPDFWDYLYHSVITFTSLGYSNIVPNLEIGHLAQGLVAAESILGAFLIALIIFTITYRVSK